MRNQYAFVIVIALICTRSHGDYSDEALARVNEAIDQATNQRSLHPDLFSLKARVNVARELAASRVVELNSLVERLERNESDLATQLERCRPKVNELAEQMARYNNQPLYTGPGQGRADLMRIAELEANLNSRSSTLSSIEANIARAREVLGPKVAETFHIINYPRVKADPLWNRLSPSARALVREYWHAYSDANINRKKMEPLDSIFERTRAGRVLKAPTEGEAIDKSPREVTLAGKQVTLRSGKYLKFKTRSGLKLAGR